MPTARVHLESVGGFNGDARCFELDPPFVDPDTGQQIQYVVVDVIKAYRGHSFSQAIVFAANEHGRPLGPSMRAIADYSHPWQATHWPVLTLLGYEVAG